MNSFASSASLVVVRIVCAARRAEQRLGAVGRPRSSSAPMIWGSVWSSSRAWPSAIRSGQKATSTLRPRACEVLGHVLGRARVDRAAQDDQRAVAEVRRDLVDGPLEDRHRRAEELVDRRADDDDELSVRSIIVGVGAELEAAGRRGARASSSSAPFSRNGISPAAMRSSVAWLMS